jgi:Tol biopolymer transport system component
MVAAPPAHAAFPGANGKIAFWDSTSGHPAEIYLVNPDGSGRVQLTQGPSVNVDPAWSPDGRRIAFASNRDDPNDEIYVMNADGTNIARLTNNSSSDRDPAWSPDGTKLLFTRDGAQGPDIYRMNADGSGVTRLTFSGARTPAWSPDGTKVAFSAADIDTGEEDIEVADPDFSTRVDLTNNPYSPEESPDWSPDGQFVTFMDDGCGNDDQCHMDTGYYFATDTIRADGTQRRNSLDYPTVGPVWSPDGSRIAAIHQNCTFAFRNTQCRSADLVTMNPDGSGKTNLTNNPDGTFSGSPSWQPIPINTYPRPRGATPLYASLVPAFKQCTAPNDTHGAPLSYGSCSSPQQASSYLTVGTPDANGQAAATTGSVRYATVLGNPSTPANEADLKIDVSITGVLKKADLTAYTGQLSAGAGLRITDRNNTPSPGGPGAATAQDGSFPVTVPCASGSCSVATTANAVMPGSVLEGKRAIWQLGQVQVYDGGADGAASTAADNTLFMDEGIFIP